MKRVYVSGPMTGLPDLNFPAFNAAAAQLRAQGLDVVNPAEINVDGEKTWEQCMRADITALCDCDTIALLPGWERSRGAHLEVHIAHRLGLQVMHLGFDLAAHLQRQAEFSARTFGPGADLERVTDHIAKELIEVRESGGALAEWVDVIILAFDGAWRSGASPEQIIAAMVAKQAKNEARKWPDWRTAAPGKAIEHDRTAEV